MTPKQTTILRGFAKHNYSLLSAIEAGDSGIQQLFKLGLVESYWGSGGVIWYLTRQGREKLVQLDLAKTADRLVIDAASGPEHNSACDEAADEIERLRAALKECSDDLENEIEHRYRDTLDYPSQKLKFDRDMEPVLTARKLLAT